MAKINNAWSKSLIFLVRCYQYSLSALVGNCCRFYPSCSNYTIDALKTLGIWRGSVLALKRILRCHPWQQGGFDPIQESYAHKHD